MLNPGIFRANDVRGTVDEDLDDSVAEVIGRSYGTYIRKGNGKKVYVGYDNRPSSPMLAESLVGGLVTAGCDVLELGMVPTPVLYFAAARDPRSFGAMVTGSHLPAKSNGFKFCQSDQALYREDMEQVRDIALGESFTAGKGKRSASPSTVVEYAEHILQLRIHKSEMKVVVDCQNGAASDLAPALLKRAGVAVECLHCNLAEPYPFERPDPQELANLEPLQKRVVQARADLGIAYDGDADRLGVVDDRGNHIPADRVVAMFSGDVLQRNPGASVVYDILSSQVLVDEVIKHGGEPVACESGHSFIKAKLHREHAKLAGELSGHIFFADQYFGFDDGIYASYRLLELLSRCKNSLSQLDQALPRMFTSPEERPYCPDDKKHRIVEAAKVVFDRVGYRLILTESSVKVLFDRGWGLVRASNTEPALSLRFEASGADELKSYRRIIWSKVAEISSEYGVEVGGCD